MSAADSIRDTAKVQTAGKNKTQGRAVPLPTRTRRTGAVGQRKFEPPAVPNQERVIRDVAVCNGRPIIAGTRISAQTILEFLAAGDSVEDVLEEFPTLTRADVLACFEYASKLMGNRIEGLAVS